MTTIIATPTAIYSDSNVNAEGSVFRAKKIYRIRNKLVGCAGDNGPITAFLDALRKGRKPKMPDSLPEDGRDLSALVVDKKGIWHFDDAFTADLVLEPFMAVGSGGDAARGAMMAGATPEQAIEIACQIDNGSRGPIQVLLLADMEDNDG